MDAVRTAWDEMSGGKDIAVAVRSSATAEDLPDASFAGQQETFLNVRGLDNLVDAMHQVFASLFNDRAIAYRVHQGFDHSQVALSAGVQTMVRSDIGASGVVVHAGHRNGIPRRSFHHLILRPWAKPSCRAPSIPTSSTFTNLPSRRGKHPILRKNLGSKAIKMIYSDNPTPGKTVETVDVAERDSLRFSISEHDIIELAKMAVTIEEHYGRPMDIEWGKDGTDGKLYILQARPETVQSRSGRTIQRYTLKGHSDIVIVGPQYRPQDRRRHREGHSVGSGNGSRPAWRRARVRHDGSRLGAGHETRRRDRDESRRSYLSCGDYCTRTGHSCRCRLR